MVSHKFLRDTLCPVVIRFISENFCDYHDGTCSCFPGGIIQIFRNGWLPQNCRDVMSPVGICVTPWDTGNFTTGNTVATLLQLRGLCGCYRVYILVFYTKITLCGSYGTTLGESVTAAFITTFHMYSLFNLCEQSSSHVSKQNGDYTWTCSSIPYAGFSREVFCNLLQAVMMHQPWKSRSAGAKSPRLRRFFFPSSKKKVLPHTG